MLGHVSDTFLIGGLIDIDLSFFIVLGLFLVLAIFLNVMLFKPLLAVRDKRVARMAGARQDAAQKQETAEQLARQYETGIRQARADAGLQRAAIREEALRQQREQLMGARQRSEQQMALGLQRVHGDFEQAAKQVDTSARGLADRIVDRFMAS